MLTEFTLIHSFQLFPVYFGLANLPVIFSKHNVVANVCESCILTATLCNGRPFSLGLPNEYSLHLKSLSERFSTKENYIYYVVCTHIT